MKKPIRFTNHQEQDHRENYWRTRTPEQRLAELVRLRRKAFWAYYQQSEGTSEQYFASYSALETETLEMFFARVEQERKNRGK